MKIKSNFLVIRSIKLLVILWFVLKTPEKNANVFSAIKIAGKGDEYLGTNGKHFLSVAITFVQIHLLLP